MRAALCKLFVEALAVLSPDSTDLNIPCVGGGGVFCLGQLLSDESVTNNTYAKNTDDFLYLPILYYQCMSVVQLKAR